MTLCIEWWVASVYIPELAACVEMEKSSHMPSAPSQALATHAKGGPRDIETLLSSRSCASLEPFTPCNLVHRTGQTETLLKSNTWEEEIHAKSQVAKHFSLLFPFWGASTSDQSQWCGVKDEAEPYSSSVLIPVTLLYLCHCENLNGLCQGHRQSWLWPVTPSPLSKR